MSDRIEEAAKVMWTHVMGNSTPWEAASPASQEWYRRYVRVVEPLLGSQEPLRSAVLALKQNENRETWAAVDAALAAPLHQNAEPANLTAPDTGKLVICGKCWEGDHANCTGGECGCVHVIPAAPSGVAGQEDVIDSLMKYVWITNGQLLHNPEKMAEIVERVRNEGIESVEYTRCMKHRGTPSFNHNANGTAECGFCAVEEESAKAARVILEAALAEPTDEEWIAVVGSAYDTIPLPDALRKVRQLFSNRRKRLLPARAERDTAVEAVRTVRETVHAFLLLPHHEQLRLMLPYVTEEEKTTIENDVELFALGFRRAKATAQIYALSLAIDQAAVRKADASGSEEARSDR